MLIFSLLIVLLYNIMPVHTDYFHAMKVAAIPQEVPP